MSVELWTSPAFHEQARSWTEQAVRPLGLRLVGMGEQPHARPWSSALRFATTDGPVWFKVNAAGTRHEPALLRLLADRVPDLVPAVLAVDLDRGWSLCRDAGPALRAALPAEDAWPVWEEVLGRYAEAQLTLSTDRAALLAAGVEDLSPTALPAAVRRLLAELAAQPVGDGGLAGEDADRLEALLPSVDGWCAELAASAVPDSLQHDDLHAANVCGTGPGNVRVIDWGDASWGCPLGTMLTTMGSLAFHAGFMAGDRPLDAAPVLRARDAYLEPFTRYAGRDELVRQVQLARRTGCVTKALSYRRALVDAPRSVAVDLEFPVRDWLLELAGDRFAD